jgi:hypothetical protein
VHVLRLSSAFCPSAFFGFCLGFFLSFGFFAGWRIESRFPEVLFDPDRIEFTGRLFRQRKASISPELAGMCLDGVKARRRAALLAVNRAVIEPAGHAAGTGRRAGLFEPLNQTRRDGVLGPKRDDLFKLIDGHVGIPLHHV